MKVVSIIQANRSRGILHSPTRAVTSSIPGTSSLTMARDMVVAAAVVGTVMVASSSSSSNNNSSTTKVVVANTLEGNTTKAGKDKVPIVEEEKEVVAVVADAVDSVSNLSDQTTRSCQRAPST